MRIHVDGDGTVLALVSLGKYESFVGDDWDEDNKLVKHWVKQINQSGILVWGSGVESDWIVEFREGITQAPGFREFAGFLDNGAEDLYLVEYDALTMAAQFEDVGLLDEDIEEYRVGLPGGLYRFRIVQLVDPDADGWWDEFEDEPAFIVEYERVDAGANSVTEVPWFDLESDDPGDD